LTDNANAANGTYQMTFALYDAVSGGTQTGATVTNNAVVVTNGIFSVELDFGAASYTGADRWIEVGVKKAADPDFSILTPRQKVTSVPYAVRAANVGNAGGNSVIDAINNASTTTVINDSRLPENLVRLNPAATQFSATGNVLNLSGGNTAAAPTSLFGYRADGGFLVTGQEGTGTIPTTGAGTRMMWFPGKRAFRAGKADGAGATYWDDANVGTGSTAFGENTRAIGTNSFAAGNLTTASGPESTAFGTFDTIASGDHSFAVNGTASGVGGIAMGSAAQATGSDSVALGPSSIASGTASMAFGPCTARGQFATCIGIQAAAGGSFSVSIGRHVTTAQNDLPNSIQYSGVISLGDNSPVFSNDRMYATANNQFNVRAAGGIRFFTSCCAYNTGVMVAAGSGAWSSISDRNVKDNIIPVNSRDVLRRVLNLPISTWNYKTQSAEIRHMGAMAQDFKAAFNLGENDTSISTVDPDGVALAAIQGLGEELKDCDTKLDAQQKQIDALREQLEALKNLLCVANKDAEICQKN
jgi:hypothetical protein